MFKKIFKVFFVLFFVCKNAFATNPIAVEFWNSENGISRLNSSSHKADFYQLANFYQAQINPVLCSSATALIIKNALFYNQIPSQKNSEIIKPNNEIIGFNLYSSQESFFNEETDKIKSREIIYYKSKNLISKADGSTSEEYDPGLNLEDFAKILKIHKIKTKLHHQDKFDEQEITKFRELLKKILSDKNNFLIINFDGKVIGNKTNGHMSPAVAYDENSDSVLILDVALHKNPWYWVDLQTLLKSMNTLDGNKYRGYLIASK